MQRIIVFILWILFSLLMQTVILTDFPTIRIWTDLLFFLIIMLGLRFGLVTGLILSCVIGYIADSISMAPYGTSIISYVLTLLLIRKVMANIYLENKLSLFFWVTIFSLFRQTVQMFVISAKLGGLDINLLIFTGMLMQAAWDGLLGLFILPFLEKAMFKDWAAHFRRRGIRN